MERPDQYVKIAEAAITVHGDCPDFRGGVRENGAVLLGAQGDRHIFRPKTGRKMCLSPPCERSPVVAAAGEASIRQGSRPIEQRLRHETSNTDGKVL